MLRKIVALCVALLMVASMFPAGILASNEPAACIVRFYDASDNSEISVISNEANVYAKVKFTAPADGDAVIIVAKYNADGSLQSAVTEKVTGLTPNTEIEYTTQNISTSAVNKIRIFVWDDMKKLVPIASNYGEIKLKTSPGSGGGSSSGSSVSDGKTTSETVISSGNVNAVIPKGTAVESSSLKLTVTELVNSASGISAGENEALLPLDIHVSGIADDNTVPVIVTVTDTVSPGLNKGNLALYHVENGKTVKMEEVENLSDLVKHNQFYYKPLDGTITLAMATFSEVAVVEDTTKGWEGNFDYSWYDDASKTEFKISNADQLAAFGAIVGGINGQTQDSFTGKTVILTADINLGDDEENNVSDKIFHPIGYYYTDDKNADGTKGDYYSTVNSFEGTFDGNGHKIANFYQNTWEIKGDYDGNYYSDAMGLFGYVNGGTVKNLTVDNFSSDGEFTPTGVVAAYAVNSTFENIAITNCNPRVYNTGNGGIVGIGGNTDDPDAYKLTFTNITIDNTNKITALWGSWDVACGGLVGMFRGDGHVHMTNCHIAAKMDVYNDVCGNYQYYWYRYSGMMVGTNKNMTTDANGYTVPETDKFHAEDCTVHFGEWNDYYYCELVANSIASYTHDHQFSRLTEVDKVDVDEMTVTVGEKTSAIPTSGKQNYVVVNGEATTENATCYHFVDGEQWTHDKAGTETVDVNGDGVKETVLKENNQHIYLPFNQLFTGYGWGVKHIPVYNGENYAFDGITILDRKEANSVEKFETKFTGDFLYRVGNQNTVSLCSLFTGKDGATINSSGVIVTIDKVDEDTNVSGTFKADTSDWTKGTIQFSGTGVVKVAIQDYNYCKPTELYLEVVDAVNATGATNATSNNVVLLNDCGFSSLEVSGGYALYGNGFTMTCGSDSAVLDMGYAFVTLNSGTLDNVQIVCPNFDYAALYKSNLTSSENRSETTDKTRYFNAKSGVMASGNSQILNSRISGGRAAVNVAGGNVVVDNSRIELGAVASVLVGSANSLTLRDVTLIQKPTVSTYDSSKTLMGFSVLYLCDSEGNATPTTIEGAFIQQAWIDENDSQYVPSAGKDIVTTVLKETDYLHDIDGDGTNESLNLGFAYMPEDATKTVDEPDNITDNRTNKATIPYEMKAVKVTLSILSTTVYVYSYKNTNGTEESFKTESEYVPNKYSDIISVIYSDTVDGLTTDKSYGTDGWIYELNVDLDKLSGYALDFSKLSMSVNGVPVTDFKVDGNAKPASPVAVGAGGTTYTLTATLNGKEYTAAYKVTGTETSKESPSLVASNYEDGLCVASSYGGTWSGAAPALEGIQIKYWSVAESQYKTITLSDYTPTTPGKQNGTSTTWTYSPDNGDFTLTLTGGQVHSSNNVYAMPVVCDGKLYFVAASSNGLVNTGNSARTIQVSYSFKDNNNGEELKFSHTWSVAENKDAQYKYSDFCNGTLTKLESSGGISPCVTPDTLVTIADGSQKRIDEVTYSDELLVWNFYEGKYDTVSPAIIFNHGYDNNTVIKLVFEDGTEVKAVNIHQFFDTTTNKFATITKNTVESFVGHSFAKMDGKTCKNVKLVDYKISEEYEGAFGIISSEHYNIITGGMLSADFEQKDYDLFNYFEIGKNMTFDKVKMKSDITKYGLYTYEDFASYLTPQQFDAFNVKYMKIPVEKGQYTYEGIIQLIKEYLHK